MTAACKTRNLGRTKCAKSLINIHGSLDEAGKGVGEAASQPAREGGREGAALSKKQLWENR